MNRKDVLGIIIAQSLVLIFISFVWVSIKEEDVEFLNPPSFIYAEMFQKISFSYDSLLKGFIAGIALLILSSLIIFLTPQLKKSLNILDEMLIGKLLPIDALPIAIFSGISEEIFFRGVLQNSLGLIPASLIFALLHFPGKDFAIYALWTFFAGLLFGNLYEITQNIFIPIVAHIINNFIAILIWKKFSLYWKVNDK
ncbi:MAG: type II CAAX endopeptidase family protein [Candidatus Sericytochromatia bacterium]